MPAQVRYACRTLLKAPAFTAAAVLTLALAIGAHTALFTLVNAILLRPLPGIADPGRLVNVHVHATAPGGVRFGSFSHPNYRDLREQQRALSGLAAFNGRGVSLGGPSGPELVGAQLVSGNYFSVLGVQPMRGRLIADADDRAPGSSPVAVISHALWQRRFGGDPQAVGRPLTLNGFPFTVVGVAPVGFHGHFVGFPFEVWVPLSMAAQAAPGEDLMARQSGWLELVGRLAPGVTAAQAQASLAAVAAQLERDYPTTNKGLGVDLRPMTGIDDSLRPGVLSFLAALQAVGLAVLLIACVNVAGLLLARAATRRREVAVRLAVGASRADLVRQLLTETLVLFALGGLGGLAVAAWTADLLHAFQPSFPVPLRFDLRLDLRVVAFGLGSTLLTALLFGLAPALQASRVDLVPALKNQAAGGPGRSRLRGLFVAGQVALSVALLAGAGLLVRTLHRARSLDPGFDADGVQTARLDLSLLARDEAYGRAFYRRLVEAVQAAPAVEAVSLTRSVPLRGTGTLVTPVQVEGRAGDPVAVGFNVVAPRYFETLRLPLVAGRDFRATDGPEAPGVAIVNQALARRFWPDQDAVGRRLQRGKAALEVVGVARDSAYGRPGEAPEPHLYLPHAQSFSPRMTLLARARGDLAPLAARIRAEVAGLEKDLPVLESTPLTEAVAFALFPQRMLATIAAALGGLGLLLAGTGLYGVVAYSVSRRAREMGVRVALGARARDLSVMVVREGFTLALYGLLPGLLLAVAAGRVLRSMLHGLSPADPLALGAVAALLAAVAGVASYLPARRASAVDPMVALRYE
ncbi:MAG TPA: ABC transporter permease [Vicinamibacteria bacterium]